MAARAQADPAIRRWPLARCPVITISTDRLQGDVAGIPAGVGDVLHRTIAKSGAAVDFVSTHTYGVESCFLDEKGVDDAKLLPSPDAVIGDVRRVREQISASKYPNLPLYFTEWSTSYTPRDLVHDSYISAPYILAKLQGTKGLVQGMSYWTYADLFEEPGPPSKPFEGGFGLLNPQGIRKSAYFTYKYLHALSGKVKANDAYTAYVEMGAPAKLTQAQLDQLASVTRDAPETNRVVTVGKAGAFNLTVPMRSNDVVLVTLEPLGKPKAPT